MEVKQLEPAEVGGNGSSSCGNFSVFLLRVNLLHVTDTKMCLLSAGSPTFFLGVVSLRDWSQETLTS